MLNDLVVHHDQLERAVASLERALQLAQAPKTVEQACRGLIALLEAHLQEEVALLAKCQCQLQSLLRRRVPFDQADPLAILQDLNALSSAGCQVPAALRLVQLRHLLHEMREFLDDEEQAVFPVVRQAEAHDRALDECGCLFGEHEAGPA